MTDRLPTCLLLGLLLGAEPVLFAADDNGLTSTPATADTTIVYDGKFFSRFPNAVSVLDIINRIPAGQGILREGENSERGFATNEDRILIDGRRFTGKSNDSTSALERITVDQVERIEIIRGSSPDVKTSSQESLLNIVLKPTPSRGSGSWRIDSQYVRGMTVAFGGFVSYGRNSDTSNYQLSFKREEQRRVFALAEQRLTGADIPGQTLTENDRISFGVDTVSASVSFNPNDAHTLQLNGAYGDTDYSTRAEGLLVDASENMVGDTVRFNVEKLPEWELGGDYEIALNEALAFKVLGLHSDKSWSMFAGEDFLIEGGAIEEDFLFDIAQSSTESIFRQSLKWRLSDQHRLEFAAEFAVNELSSLFNYFERIDGELVPIEIPGSDTTINERRREAYVLHTWSPNEAWVFETTLGAEASTIKQTGESFRSRDFSFFKPGIDIRFDRDANQQYQLSVRRDIGQLNFGDFGASADIDNNVYSGNTELVPEKQWQYDFSYERRLPDDAGRIVATLSYHEFEDKIELIPLTDSNGDTISAVGNIGDGYLSQLEIAGSFRLSGLSLPNLIIEPTLRLTDTKVTDPFTGRPREFDMTHEVYFRVDIWHDITDWGLSYGGAMAMGDERVHFDYDEIATHNRFAFYRVFAEYQLGRGIILRAEANDLSNFDRGRDRLFYLGGVETGIITSRELVEHREGRVFNLSLRGPLR